MKKLQASSQPLFFSSDSMPILFDIGMNFFFNNARPLQEDCLKKEWMQPLNNNLNSFPDKPNAVSCYYYHGSPVPNLTQLEGKPLFLSPSPSVAVCFGLPLNTDEGWIHGVDHLSGEMPIVYIALPKGKEKCLENSMTLYWVESSPDCHPAGEGYATEKILQVVGKIHFATIREALNTYGVSVGIRGQEKLHPALCKMVKSMPEAVENYLEMPLDAILSLPLLENTLLLFLAGRDDLPAHFLQQFPFRIWRKVLDRVLLPLCSPFWLHPKGWHGLGHGRSVALWAGALAWMQGRSPLPPMVAGCLHDSARIDDAAGEQHAHDGAQVAEFFLNSEQGKRLPLSDSMRQEIVEAIYGHATPCKTSHPVAACLQDADRLRLSWGGRVKEDLFSTAEGLEIAKGGSQYGENILNFLESLGDEEHPLEYKIKINDACNFACRFCYQGFGIKN